MVPLKLFKNQSVLGAALSGFCVHIIFGVILTYLPILYQSRGSSPLQSGIDILPFMISSVVSVTLAGFLVKRIGYYKFWLVGGPWVCAVGAGFLTNGAFLGPSYLIGWQIITGAGFGVTFQNTSTFFILFVITWYLCLCSDGRPSRVCPEELSHPTSDLYGRVLSTDRTNDRRCVGYPFCYFYPL